MFENFSEMMLELFATSLWETVIMVGASGILGALVGIPLGVFLRLTDKGGILQNAPANAVVGGIVNAARSTPFIILLVAIIPFTRLITGTSLGTTTPVAGITRLEQGIGDDDIPPGTDCTAVATGPARTVIRSTAPAVTGRT